MRHKLIPLILSLIGLGLILIYLIQQNEPSSSNPQEGAPKSATAFATAVHTPSGNQPQASTSQTEPTTFPVTASMPSRTPFPALPTPTEEHLPTAPDARATISSTITASIDSASVSCPLSNCIARLGVSGRLEIVAAAHQAGLPFGAYFNWSTEQEVPFLESIEFWQTVDLAEEGPTLPWSDFGQVVDARPGSIWIVGNEPDIIWQDNLTPERYAHIYHDIYTFIKERDPTAQIAIGAVGQPTPLRRIYLDRVLDEYQTTFGRSMPVDIWTVHNFILREEAGSWGVDIPPGLEGSTGQLYEIDDHDNLDIFRQNLIDFRAWMDEHGYDNHPLAVTEFGILHPSDYGFPPEIVSDFMMGAFEFLLNATNETGFPADDDRLVQWSFWYSVYDDGDYQTGNLYDPNSGKLTPIGELFAAYLLGE